MYEGIKCYNKSDKIIYFAHELYEDDKNKYYSCGVCLRGGFNYIKQLKILNAKNCSICFCIIEYSNKEIEENNHESHEAYEAY
jgi:hypothetical protein